ncbi:MAG: UDP-N-acetylglucosamine 1-carboxyvinyltransferase [Phycisphaeraceae bacterium]
MDAFVINGGRPLHGTLRINGSKNASLPLMAAALLTHEPVTLRDVPDLSDIRNMARLLRSIGCEIEHPDGEPHTLKLHVNDEGPSTAEYDIVRTMRAGICVLGPLLAKRGHARVSMPGGCAIGDRPVDLHLRGLEKLGARIDLDSGYIVAEGPAGPGSRLRGSHIFLGGPNGSTVLGTANVMSAATLAEGTTVIEAAACEPEIEDVANLLNKMGARIRGAGTPRVIIDGVPELYGAATPVMPDRIVAGTYVIAAAITNGQVTLENFPTAALTAALDRLHAIGIDVVGEPASAGGHALETNAETPSSPSPLTTLPSPTDLPLTPSPETVTVRTQRRLAPVHVVTQPHTGFPTDLQAQFMALLSLADGNSIVTEKIFPDRFLHVAELLRMGADLTRSGPTVLVSGVKQLVGAPVMASDLRASAGLVLAALAAHGQTLINRVYHLDRGYESMERELQHLGADIERVDRPAV